MKKLIFTLCLVSLPSIAFGSVSGSPPWEGPMTKLVEALTGPFLRSAAVVAIVAAGIGFAFGEGDIFRKIMMIVVGLSIATAATGWGLSFFGL